SPVWSPDDGQVGAFILITGSVIATVFSVLLSTPISVGVALFVTEVAPVWARQFMQPVLELLTGIPSIIYGLIGLQVLVPIVPTPYKSFAGENVVGGGGFGITSAVLVLTLMILPTITTISIDALAGLPQGLREASLALGATRWQTIQRTLVPAASSGIFTG